jgi:hypothetical protein
MAAHQSVSQPYQRPPGEHLVARNGVKLHCIVSGCGPLLVVQAPGWGIGSAYLQNGLTPLEENSPFCSTILPSVESLRQPVPKNEDQFQKYFMAIRPFYF